MASQSETATTGRAEETSGRPLGARRTAYVNGAYVPLDRAQVSVLDRGFLFGDGVYEVAPVLDGRLFTMERTLGRLKRSMDEIGLVPPIPLERIGEAIVETARRNALEEGRVYLQVTRGVAERDFGHPAEGTKASLVMFTQEAPLAHSPKAEAGVDVVTVADLRWERRDIKSISLLAQVMAKQAAVAAGAYEAWMVEDGFVTEGSSSTAFIVTKAGAIVTRPLSNEVLPGLTRQALLELAEEQGLDIEERRFTPEEALGASEAFFTSASSIVMPVVRIDGRAIGESDHKGVPGPTTKRLRAIYLDMARAVPAPSIRDVSADG